jgi:hypothetical protein
MVPEDDIEQAGQRRVPFCAMATLPDLALFPWQCSGHGFDYRKNNNGSLGRPQFFTRVYTPGLHLPNPVAPEKTDFIEFFAPQESLADREGFAPPCSKMLKNMAFCLLFPMTLYHRIVPSQNANLMLAQQAGEFLRLTGPTIGRGPIALSLKR